MKVSDIDDLVKVNPKDDEITIMDDSLDEETLKALMDFAEVKGFKLILNHKLHEKLQGIK